jgi:hypothetical protein
MRYAHDLRNRGTVIKRILSTSICDGGAPGIMEKSHGRARPGETPMTALLLGRRWRMT